MLCRSRSPYEVWSDCMSLFAITISNSTTKQLTAVSDELKQIWDNREKEYLRIINKYDKKEQKLFPQMFALMVNELEERPDQDLLGALYMQAGIGNKNAGQFFTPYNLCDAMSRLTIDKKTLAKQVHTKGYVSVNDCACGAGATLVSASEQCKKLFKKLNYQNHVYFIGQDVDITCVHMCYIQLSLHGLAGYVIHGNTLTEPHPKSLSQIWFTPVWFSNVWSMRRMFHNQDILGNERKQNGK